MKRPRVLIEEWLPAAAIGVECMRERGSASALAPTTYLHVWWARRPLTVSRAAVLGSLLPADFPREVFEKLLGFGQPAADLVRIRQLMDTGYRVPGGFNCDRAFKRALRDEHLQQAHAAVQRIWEMEPVVIDPMAGGGSIPLESARLGFRTIASEYNPVACTVLEATVDYPFRHGERLAALTRKWAKVWGERILKRLGRFYPEHRFAKVHAYIFARTVPCPNTQHHTPLVPDWHLLRPKTETRLVAVPRAHRDGTWSVQMCQVGRRAGQLREAPPPTYSDGKGISLFTNLQIPADYIKAKAQAGEMKSALYAVALKTPQGPQFRPPTDADLDALEQAAAEMKRVRCGWEKSNIIPTEAIPGGDQPGTRLEIAGITAGGICFRRANFSASACWSRSCASCGRRSSNLKARTSAKGFSICSRSCSTNSGTIMRCWPPGIQRPTESVVSLTGTATRLNRLGPRWRPAIPAQVWIGRSTTC